MKITQAAVAGTLESGDVMIRIAPVAGEERDLHISSSVEKQFGAAIRASVLEILERYGIDGIQLILDDKGALDCVLRARLETALCRAGAEIPFLRGNQQ